MAESVYDALELAKFAKDWVREEDLVISVPEISNGKSASCLKVSKACPFALESGK